VLSSQKLNKALAKTMAATLGRFGLGMPEKVGVVSSPILK